MASELCTYVVGTQTRGLDVTTSQHTFETLMNSSKHLQSLIVMQIKVTISFLEDRFYALIGNVVTELLLPSPIPLPIREFSAVLRLISLDEFSEQH